MDRLELALQGLVRAENTPQARLAGLVAAIRPVRPGEIVALEGRLQTLCGLLQQQPDYRQALRQTLMEMLEGSRQISLYVESGILPNSGFFSELSHRLGSHLLPEVADGRYLKDALDGIFSDDEDFRWLERIPLQQWRDLHAALGLDRLPVRETLQHTQREMLEAVQVLSYRITAVGLDPELLRNEPSLEDYESPFMTQNAEVLAYLADYRAWLLDATYLAQDERHIKVLLGQCRQALERVRRTSMQRGASITLTYKMQRLVQNMDRMEGLLDLLSDWRDEAREESLFIRSVTLLVGLVREENRRHNLRDHVRRTLELVALRVTENASRTGEHYITSTRDEYFAMFKSALGGGLVIGFMALLKIKFATYHLPPLTEALVFSLNYGLGFMLIHMLGFSVATKQPAMTAAAIAASIEESGGAARSLDNLVTLIARTLRTQAIAILGNVGMVVPVAMTIGGLTYLVGGAHFIGIEKAHHLLESIHPLGMTLIYAAIAGVCLFLAGQIAGYYDNLCVYNRIPERLQQLPRLRRLLGEARLARVAAYVENNLGALAGNFFFGLLLGGTAAIGVLFGLPVDIRHITFSGAYWGFSLVALDFHLAWQVALIAFVGVFLIGFVNLAVSFSLALTVALKARQVTFQQGGRQLALKVLQRLWKSPREFFLPPPAGKE